MYYDEIKMLKVWIEIELLCNKKKIENTYRKSIQKFLIKCRKGDKGGGGSGDVDNNYYFIILL